MIYFFESEYDLLKIFQQINFYFPKAVGDSEINFSFYGTSSGFIEF
jgi:hypothetical protein